MPDGSQILDASILHIHPEGREVSISVDDLPPTLKPRFLPHDLVDTGEKRKFEIGLLIGGFVCLAIGSSLSGLIYAQWPTISALWKTGFLVTIKGNWLILASVCITALPALLLIVIGPMMAIGVFYQLLISEKTFYNFSMGFRKGCETETDANRIMNVLPKRFGSYDLSLHPTKTVILPFGKPSASTRKDRRNGKFDFLGFTFFWARSKKGYWIIKKKTSGKRINRRCSKFSRQPG